MKPPGTQIWTYFILAAITLSILPNAASSKSSAIAETQSVQNDSKPTEPAVVQPAESAIPWVTITGHIIDPANTPGANLRVQLLMSNGRLADEVRAAPDGTFRFPSHQIDAYRLQILTLNGRPLPWEGDQLFTVDIDEVEGEARREHAIFLMVSIATQANVREASTNENVLEIAAAQADQLSSNDPILQNTGQISGTLTRGDNGQPVERGFVRLVDVDGRHVETEFIDANGRYHFQAIPAGQYKLEFDPLPTELLSAYYDDQPDLESATIIALDAGEPLIVNATLSLGATIEGTVTGNDTPLESVFVKVYNADGRTNVSDSTDSNGRYRLLPLPPGQYWLEFAPQSHGPSNEYLPEFYNNQSSLDSATVLEIISNETVSADAELARGGKIEGTVRGENMTLERVRVRLFNSTGATIMSKFTDANGYYQFSPLFAGEYRLKFEPSSLNEANGFLPQYYEGKSDLGSATIITITADETTVADATLKRGGTIEGVVTGDNVALEDISVNVYDSNGDRVDSSTTDANGFYRIQSLVPGNYRLEFIPIVMNGVVSEFLAEYYDSQPSLETATNIQIVAGETVTINADLVSGGVIQGRVTGKDLPLEDILVKLYDADKEFVKSALTDSNGNYRFYPLSSGQYSLEFMPGTVNGQPSKFFPEFYDSQPDLDSAATIEIVAGETVTISAELVQGGTLEGTITGEGNLLDDITVSLFHMEGDEQLSGTVKTVRGDYLFQPLSPGQYKLRFEPLRGGASSEFLPEYYDDQPDLDSATMIPIVADETITADVVLSRGGAIEGTISGENGPLEDVDVFLYDSTGKSLKSVSTKADGHYRLPGLFPGEYRLKFEPPNRGEASVFLPEYHENQADLDSATVITIAADETVMASAGLVRGGTIKGTITGESKPLERITVRLYDSTGELVKSEFADANGFYQMPGLFPGEYRLEFEPRSSGESRLFLPEYYDSKSDLGSATPVTISAGETMIVNADLIRGGTIEGTIIGEGVPAEGVWVRLYNAAGRQVERKSTDVEGFYRIQPLPPGAYRLEFTPLSSGPSAEFLSKFYDDQPDLNSATPILIVGEETKSANADLRRGAKIQGQVTAQEANIPLPDVRITIFDSNERFVDSVRTDASGFYTIVALPSDSYSLKLTTPEVGLSGEYLSRSLEDTIALVAPEVRNNLNIQLKRGGRITGQVTVANTQRNAGIPLPAIHVSVYNLRGNLVDSTTTDASGAYTVTKLVDGHYWIVARPATGGLSAQYLPGHYLDPIPITAPELVSNINLSLEPGGQIAGRVTDEATGSPLENISVEFYDAAERFMIDSATTDAAGFYTTTAFFKGRYRVKFEPPSYGDSARYQEEYYDNSSTFISAAPVNITDASIVKDINAALTPLPPYGQITGTVFAQNSGLPLQGVHVRAYHASSGNDDTGYVDGDLSDQNGLYQLTELPPGDYRIKFQPPNGSTVSVSDLYQKAYYNGKSSMGQFDPVHVESLLTIGNIDATLILGGQISGTVAAVDTGQTLGDVGVVIYNANGERVAGTTTDDMTGNFVFRGLPNGDYRLRYAPPFDSTKTAAAYPTTYSGGKPDLVSATPVRVNAPNISQVRASLAKGGQIAGQIVRAEGGAPISDHDIVFYSVDSGERIAGSQTDDAGRYISPGFVKGSYWVEISSSADLLGPIELSPPELVDNVDGSLSKDEAGSGLIAGRVIAEDTSRPLEDVSIDVDGCPVHGNDDTGRLGIYYIDELASGSFTMALEPDDHSPSAPYRLVQLGTHQLEPGEQRIERLIMPLGGRVVGRVTAEDTGQPLKDVDVSIYDVTRNYYVGTVETDEDGQYRTNGLADGDYRLLFLPEPGVSYLWEYSGNQRTFEQAEAIAIRGARIVANQDTVLTRGGQISGVVTAADTGLPLDDVDVWFYDSNGRLREITETDGKGEYKTAGLLSDDYRILFMPEDHEESARYAYAYYNDRSTLSDATEVSVKAPQHVPNINAVLEPGGQLTGRVTSEQNGQPLNDVRIRGYDELGNRVADGETNRGGIYRTSGVGPGDYRVEFAARDRCSTGVLYADEYYNDKPELASANPVSVNGVGLQGNVNVQLKAISATRTPTPTSTPTATPTSETPKPTRTSTATPTADGKQERLFLPLIHTN